MAQKFSVVIQREGDWWIGWITEIPGVNSQGRTRDELLDNLWDALDESLQKSDANPHPDMERRATRGGRDAFERVLESVPDAEPMAGD